MSDLSTVLRPLSKDTIQMFSAVATEAAKHLEDLKAGTLFSSVWSGGFVDNGKSSAETARLIAALRENYEHLSKEPSIARVVAKDQQGERKTFFICRAGGGIQGLVGRNAPLGRLASLDIGDELKWNGTTHTVLEHAHLRPTHPHGLWDSRDSIIETETLGPITIKSLRVFLEEAPIEDLVARIQQAANQDQNIFEGKRRTIVKKMALRDQPTLDKFQDEIFRLPLNHRLVLLGPPGTGKTTTLIRRLGQKVTWDVLEPEEQELIKRSQGTGIEDHATSWVMFTPTKLLKDYLKEAFAREGVPATNHQIKTWEDHCLALARNHFGILRNASGRGSFILKPRQPLNQEALADLTRWYEDFNDWQRATLLDDFREALEELARAAGHGLQGVEKPQAVHELVKRLRGHLHAGDPQDMASKVEAILVSEGPRIEKLVDELKVSSDRIITDAINRLLNRDRTLISNLARFLEGISQAQEPSTGEQEDPLTEDEGDDSAPQTFARTDFDALSALKGAVRSKIRFGASEPPKAVGRNSRAGKLLIWLEERGAILDLDTAVLGPMLVALAAAREFTNPVRRLLEAIPRRYRTFRRQRQKEGRWYRPDGFDHSDIHPLEMDGILLAMLRETGELLHRSHVCSQLETQKGWGPLRTLDNYHRNQVLVDEATDFSPIQLACMAALASPHTRSFFACGDFNQRLTTWGTRSSEALSWAIPDLEFRTVNITYRQTRQLNELAHALVRLSGGPSTLPDLPPHTDAEGVGPALLEGAPPEETVSWLAKRICEIERFVGYMPSTAIFVNSEAEMVAMAQQLNDHLANYNKQATACHAGQSLGDEENIRVFDIRHIKGLEFEAVFFVDVDRLAKEHPDLFDKFLYVGATRAATYLGITCEQALPVALDSVRPLFVPNWENAHTPVLVN